MDINKVMLYIIIVTVIIILLVGLLSLFVAIYLAFEKKAGTGEVKDNESKDYKLDKL